MRRHCPDCFGQAETIYSIYPWHDCNEISQVLIGYRYGEYSYMDMDSITNLQLFQKMKSKKVHAQIHRPIWKMILKHDDFEFGHLGPPCRCLQRGRLMWIPPKQRCSSRFWTLVVMEALTGRTDETTGKWWMMNDEHLKTGEETSIGWELQFDCRNILKCFELQQSSPQKASLRASNEVERNISSETSEYSQICFGHAVSRCFGGISMAAISSGVHQWLFASAGCCPCCGSFADDQGH